MKNPIIPTLPFLMNLISVNSHAQQPSKVYITDKISETYAYVDVTKTYERVAAKGYKSVDLFQKLGNAFYDNLEMEKAAKWYGELFSLTYNLEPVYYNRYAECLKCIGKAEMAEEIMIKMTQVALLTKQNVTKKKKKIK